VWREENVLPHAGTGDLHERLIVPGRECDARQKIRHDNPKTRPDPRCSRFFAGERRSKAVSSVPQPVSTVRGP